MIVSLVTWSTVGISNIRYSAVVKCVAWQWDRLGSNPSLGSHTGKWLSSEARPQGVAQRCNEMVLEAEHSAHSNVLLVNAVAAFQGCGRWGNISRHPRITLGWDGDLPRCDLSWLLSPRGECAECAKAGPAGSQRPSDSVPTLTDLPQWRRDTAGCCALGCSGRATAQGQSLWGNQEKECNQQSCLMDYYYYLYFLQEKTEAQRGEWICPSSYHQ